MIALPSLISMRPATVHYDSIISAVDLYHLSNQTFIFSFSVVQQMFISQRKMKHLTLFAVTASPALQ